MRLEIVTAERELLSATDVDRVVAPAADGQITILPRHASLISLLEPGELRVYRRGQETVMAVAGGFLEVHNSQVRILADAAEESDEIDVARAQAAAERARALLANRKNVTDFRTGIAALRRSQVRLKVARRRGLELPAR